MAGLEIVVILLLTLLVFSWLARRFGLSEPVMLLTGGIVVGLAADIPPLQLPAEVVLLLFLPPILYAESLTISLQQIRANLRVIVLLSVGLVMITALTVAGTAYAFGLAGTAAFVLGSVLAPTDAAAVASVSRGLPRRLLTTLRAESLVNDGTALVLFAVTVEIAAGRTAFSWETVLVDFVLSYGGGIGIGAGVALAVIAVRRRLDDQRVESGLSVLTPFAAYLPAELAEVSGVLAVVTCGLMITRVSPLLIRARSRLQTFAFWDITSYLLNGTLFVLIGVELPTAVAGLQSLSLPAAGGLAAAVAGTVIGTRLLYLNVVPYVVRLLDRRPGQRTRRVSARYRVLGAWSGVRGGISLAAALAVPSVTEDGSRLVGRDVIVFVTAAFIVGTLLLQGQTLQAVVRWAGLAPDTGPGSEELVARQRMLGAARRELPYLAARFGVSGDVADRMRRELDEHQEELEEEGAAFREGELPLRLALLTVKRNVLVALRDSGELDDAVLREIQEGLDADELHLELRAQARTSTFRPGGATPPQEAGAGDEAGAVNGDGDENGDGGRGSDGDGGGGGGRRSGG